MIKYIKQKINKYFIEKSLQSSIEIILGRGVKWSDYKVLPLAQRRKYYQQAQAILDNPVFKNEINHYIDDLSEFILKESKSHDQTIGLRMGIQAVESLKNRFESIPNPDKQEPTKEDLHSAI